MRRFTAYVFLLFTLLLVKESTALPLQSFEATPFTSTLMQIDSTEYPPFAHTDLINLDGETVNTKDIIDVDKISVVIAWATWCPQCREHFNNHAEYYKEWQEKYNMEIIAIEAGYSDLGKINSTLEKTKWPFTFFSDTYTSEDMPSVTTIGFEGVFPTIFIVKNGVVLESFQRDSKDDKNILQAKLEKYYTLD